MLAMGIAATVRRELLLAAIWHQSFLTTIMADHYPLVEFLCSSVLHAAKLFYFYIYSKKCHYTCDNV